MTWLVFAYVAPRHILVATNLYDIGSHVTYTYPNTSRRSRLLYAAALAFSVPLPYASLLQHRPPPAPLRRCSRLLRTTALHLLEPSPCIRQSDPGSRTPAPMWRSEAPQLAPRGDGGCSAARCRCLDPGLRGRWKRSSPRRPLHHPPHLSHGDLSHGRQRCLTLAAAVALDRVEE